VCFQSKFKYKTPYLKLMVDIGIVGLDTSHGESFADRISAHDRATVSAVWDGGSVRDDSFIEAFCEEYGARQYEDPEGMISEVDAVMILTVDWDTHRPLAVPFLEAGIPTLIDKPIAGTLGDIRALEASANGTPLFGGSAVPYHSKIRSFERDRSGRALYCVGYDDPFYYGPHLVDTVCRIIDEDWSTVSPADDPGRTVDVVFTDGTYVTLRLDSPRGEKQFSFLSIGNRTTLIEIGNGRAEMDDMYQHYLDAFLETIDGGRSNGERILNAATLLLGIDAALEYGQPITPDSPILAEHAVEGDAFLEAYSPYY